MGTQISLCSKCGKSFCQKHTSCEYCHCTITAASLLVESRETYEISWIRDRGYCVGLVGFSEVPREVSEILTNLRKAQPRVSFEIIVFPDKKLSNDFRAAVYPDIALKGFKVQDPPAASRFAILYAPDTGRRSILLNKGAIKSGSIPFVLSLVLHPEYDELALRQMIGKEIVGKTCLQVLQRHNTRLGIPFVSSNRHTREWFTVAVIRLNESYTASKTVHEITTGKNLSDASEYVEQQIQLILNRVNWEIIHVLDETLDLLWKIIRAQTSVASVSRYEVLKSQARIVLDTYIDQIKARLRDRPDLIEAISLILEKFNGEDLLSCRLGYIEKASDMFNEATSLLSCEYSRLDEILELAVAVRDLDSQLQTNQPLPISRFGTVDSVSKILSAVFEKEKIAPETSIMAGQTLLTLNQALMVSSYDYLAFSRAVIIGKRLAGRIIESHEMINRLNPDLQIRKEDAAMSLLVASAAAKMYEEPKEAEAIEKEARAIIDQYNLLHLKCLIDWTDFLITQGYDYLLKIYRNFQRAVLEQMPGIDQTTQFLGHLASAVFEPRNRKKHLKSARDFALEMRVGPQPSEKSIELEPELGVPLPTPVSEFMSNLSGEMSLYFAELFEVIMEIDSEGPTNERIRQAELFTNALKEIVSDIHPSQTLLAKTYCLLALLRGQAGNLERGLSLLNSHSEAGKHIRSFIELCKISTSTADVKFRIIEALESDLDKRDPWNHIALLFVNARLKSELSDINIFEYDALFFVEGSSDKSIFQEFSKLVNPNIHVKFIRAEGWNSYRYYVNAEVARQAHLPVVVVFDGDTSQVQFEQTKARLLKMLPQEVTIVDLRQRTIENYLLVPRAVRAAIPDISVDEAGIANYFRQNTTKKNKKEVLDSMLKKYADVSYDGHIGATIVENMLLSEVDPEIRSIFANVSPRTSRTKSETGS